MNRRAFLAAVAGGPLALAGLRVPRVVAGEGRPIALITADLESHVVAVDVADGSIVRRLPTLPGPRSIESVGAAAAVVAHTAGGAVSIVDAVPLRARAVLRGFGEPRYTAASPDLRHAYVSDSGRGEVVVVDVRRARIVRRTRVGGPARHITIDAPGRRCGWRSAPRRSSSPCSTSPTRPGRDWSRSCDRRFSRTTSASHPTAVASG